MRKINKNYPADEFRVFRAPLPWIVQAPTFATVKEAYAYFTRHKDEYAEPSYSDDSDDIPEFDISGDVMDFFSDHPNPSAAVGSPPSEAEPLSSPADDDRGAERSDKPSEEDKG